MGRKKSKKIRPESSDAPRRGKRRSIRYEAQEEWPDERRPARDPEAPPTIQLRLLTVDEALGRLAAQLRAWQGQGQREVLVVHGKGQNSPQGLSVLGPAVRSWCDENAQLVGSWREAPRKWGGAGAIVVVLQ